MTPLLAFPDWLLVVLTLPALWCVLCGVLVLVIVIQDWREDVKHRRWAKEDRERAKSESVP